MEIVQLFLMVFLTLLAKSFAQMSVIGPCPQVKPMANLDISRMGKWYEIQRYPNIYEYDQKCNVFNFTKDEKSIDLTVTAINTVSGGHVKMEGQMQPTDDPLMGQFRLQHPIYAEQRTSYMTILYTDYENLKIIRGCQSLHDKSLIYLWVLSKNKTLDPKYLPKLEEVVKGNQLSLNALKTTDQKNCPETN